jgi:hypothetical protein
MTLSLVLGYALTVLPVPESPRTPADRTDRWLAEMSRDGTLKRWSGGYLDDYLSLHLRLARNRQEIIRGMIAYEEKLIADFGEIFTPEEVLRLLRDLDADRQELNQLEKWIEALERCEAQRKLKPDRETAGEAMERLEQLYRQLWPLPRRGS